MGLNCPKPISLRFICPGAICSGSVCPKHVPWGSIKLVPAFPGHIRSELFTINLYLIFFLSEQSHWLRLCFRYSMQEIIESVQLLTQKNLTN